MGKKDREYASIASKAISLDKKGEQRKLDLLLSRLNARDLRVVIEYLLEEISSLNEELETR